MHQLDQEFHLNTQQIAQVNFDKDLLSQNLINHCSNENPFKNLIGDISNQTRIPLNKLIHGISEGEFKITMETITQMLSEKNQWMKTDPQYKTFFKCFTNINKEINKQDKFDMIKQKQQKKDDEKFKQKMEIQQYSKLVKKTMLQQSEMYEQLKSLRNQNQNYLEEQQFKSLKNEILHIKNQEDDTPIIEEEIVQDQQYLDVKLKVPCYICKKKYDKIHFFYHKLCPECAEYNYEKRKMQTDLTGKYALISGARTKIGFEAALSLLNNGAIVYLTTRFPKNAIERFSQQKTYENWKSRLFVICLDLKVSKSVQEFCDFLLNEIPHLDIIINNAAQTVRKKPIAFHDLVQNEFKSKVEDFNIIPFENNSSKHLLLQIINHQITNLENNNLNYNSDETNSISLLKKKNQIQKYLELQKNTIENCQKNFACLVSQVPVNKDDLIIGKNYHHTIFDNLNDELINVDKINSWTAELENIDLDELHEVFAINCIAPFIFNTKLKPLMNRIDSPKFIVNVSAMEGVFYMQGKSSCHAHTNMAKAALNMMTRTAGLHYAQSDIFMSAVDTGWVTSEIPILTSSKEFVCPLDEVDGAMRILDPIYQGFNGQKNLHSVFFKDYKISSW